MICKNCHFYRPNDSLCGFGTCKVELVPVPYPADHECELSESEIRKIEGLTGHKRTDKR